MRVYGVPVESWGVRALSPGRGRPLLPGLSVDFNKPMTSLPGVLLERSATYSRNSNKLNPVGPGQFDLLTANQFGTRYDPVTGLWGYYPERAATNEALYSDNQLGAAWSATNITPTISATPAPYAGSNAYDLTVTSIAAEPMLTQAFTASGTNKLHSIYFYADSNHQWWRLRWRNASATNFVSVWFDAQNGVVGSTATGGTAAIGQFRVDNIGGGWYRVVFRCNANGGATFGIAPKDADASDAYTTANGAVLTIWQYDNHGSASDSGSPIITAAATASRLTDQLTIPITNIAGLVPANGFTLYAEVVIPMAIVSSALAVIIAIESDGTNTNDFFISYANTGVIGFTKRAGGVSVSTGTAACNYGAVQKIAAVYSPTDGLLLSVDGVTIAGNANATLPTGLATVCIGNMLTTTRAALCTIVSAGVITKPLTQAQINAMTTL